MNTRIFAYRQFAVFALVVTAVSAAEAQNRPGFFTDPATGLVYRQVTRSVEVPVVDTKIEQQEQTVYTPQTVKETRPETKTVFTPVTEYQWHSYVEGRWNPFRQPTIAYRPVANTHWEARNETIQRTQTRTQWVAEKRTIEVPHRIVRMDRKQDVQYEVVGRVTPDTNNVAPAIASRLQPLANNSSVQPINGGLPSPAAIDNGAARIAAINVGRMTSDPPRRTSSQTGMRSTQLQPTAPIGYGQALPPVGGTSGVANLPGIFWRR